MPLFIDRHDAPGVQTIEVAKMHLADLEVGPRHGAKFITYWWDESSGSGFCLVDAPNEEAVRRAHGEAHGAVPGRVVRADEHAVLQFLGRVEDPPIPGPIAESAFRTIMFTDIENSTSLTQQLGDARAMQMLRLHDGVVSKALAGWNGTQVKHTGDGIMASFLSAVDGVSAAIAMQKKFSDPEVVSGAPLRVRIGLSAGEPVTEHGDIFGAAVQLARRCCDAGEPGSIFVANVVRDLCIGKGITFEERGDVSLKGFVEPVRLFAVRW